MCLFFLLRSERPFRMKLIVLGATISYCWALSLVADSRTYSFCITEALYPLETLEELENSRTFMDEGIHTQGTWLHKACTWFCSAHVILIEKKLAAASWVESWRVSMITERVLLTLCKTREWAASTFIQKDGNSLLQPKLNKRDSKAMWKWQLSEPYLFHYKEAASKNEMRASTMGRKCTGSRD